MKRKDFMYLIMAIAIFTVSTLFSAQEAEAYHHGCTLTNLGTGSCHDETPRGTIHCDPGPLQPGDIGLCEESQN